MNDEELLIELQKYHRTDRLYYIECIDFNTKSFYKRYDTVYESNDGEEARIIFSELVKSSTENVFLGLHRLDDVFSKGVSYKMIDKYSNKAKR